MKKFSEFSYLFACLGWRIDPDLGRRGFGFGGVPDKALGMEPVGFVEDGLVAGEDLLGVADNLSREGAGFHRRWLDVRWFEYMSQYHCPPRSLKSLRIQRNWRRSARYFRGGAGRAQPSPSGS